MIYGLKKLSFFPVEFTTVGGFPIAFLWYPLRHIFLSSLFPINWSLYLKVVKSFP